MNVKDSLTDILMQEKDIVKVYGTVLTEGSNNEVRSVIEKNMKVIAGQQFEVFENMQQRGFYPLKMAETAEINETKQNFSQN